MSADGIRITQDNVAKALEQIRLLAKKEILVGIPAADAQRYAPGEDNTINNAMIGYWMEFGIPSENVPARPSLVPGVQSVMPKIESYLQRAARAAAKGDAQGVDASLHAAGLTAQLGVQKYINAGVGPALSDYTVWKRAQRGRKGAKQELKNRAAGQAPSMTLAKPLVDTAQFRNAMTYVIKTN